MRTRLAILLLLLACCLPAAAAPFDPVGLWKLHDTDGSIFHVRLYADGSALSDWGSGESGRWAWDGKRLRCTWNSGWRDEIYMVRGGYWKEAWGPGKPRSGPATNSSRVVRLSRDPNAAPR